MELVNYSDDEEQDNTSENVETKVEDSTDIPTAMHSRWTATDSDDEDEVKKNDSTSNVQPKSTSVLELLSSFQKPSFLTKASDQQFLVKPVVINDYNAKPKAQVIEQPTPQELAKSNVMSRAEFEEIAK